MTDLEDFEPQIAGSLDRLEKLIKQIDKKGFFRKTSLSSKM